MLKIFDNYYLDASSVCYMLKKAHGSTGNDRKNYEFWLY